MWSKLKSLFSSVSAITTNTSKAWGIITLILALYGLFSTLLVRWYGSEYKTSQERLQEVSVSLSEARLEHTRYTYQVNQSLDAISGGEKQKAKQAKETLEYEGKKSGSYTVTDRDYEFFNKLSKATNQSINESHHNP